MSADLVRDYLDLPDRTALDRFIVKDESDADALARTYVFTENVKQRLDLLLTDIGRLFARGQDFQSLGRWVYGSFGSGKSHFLRVVGMMLARDQSLYAVNRDPALLELQARHAWLVHKKILVVRVSMMGKTATSSLTAALARAYDERLVELGHEPAQILGYDRIFEQFDAYIGRAPQLYAEFEDEFGYERSRFDQMRRGTYEQRRALAKDCARFMYGDAEARFEADPTDAREHMASHAKALGFDGVAFLIDEFVLWAQSLPGREYMAAVNELTGLVDAERRALPFIVLAAIQRAINETFPDDDSEKNLRESLGHTEARFRPPVLLEDRDLFEITRRRVLAVKPGRERAWREKVDDAMRDLERVKSVLVGNEPPQTLAELYPFHPALMHVLGNVSQGLQRERTSLFMLYQLLVEIRPDLAIGQLVSLGALWEALFAHDNVVMLREQAKRRTSRDAAADLIESFDAYERLVPDIRAAAAGDEEDRRVLDLVVKSVLLCQLSKTRFLGDERPLSQATTIENLVRLNRTEISARIEQSAARQVERLCNALAKVAPSSVRVDGSGADAKVHVDLQAVDMNTLLASLRPFPGERFATLRRYVAETLDLERVVGDELSGTLSVTWRETNRKGKVRLDRLDQITAHETTGPLAADAAEAFRIVVLLDVSDQSVAFDRIVSARDTAQQWTAVVIPATLTDDAAATLEILAKLGPAYERDKAGALGSYRLNEQPLVERQVAATRAAAERRLRDALALAYGRDAQIVTLRRSAPDLLTGAQRDPGELVAQIAAQLLDLRYPQHPALRLTPRPGALATLVAVVARAAREPSGRTALLSEDENRCVERLGVPLEIFDYGTGVASLRPTGSYLAATREAIAEGQTAIPALRRSLAERYGLTADVGDAVIATCAIRDDYRLALQGKTRAIDALGDLDAKGVLVKGMLPAQAAWVEGRAAAIALFGLQDVAPSLSPANVERLVELVRAKRAPALNDVAAARDALQGLQRGDWFADASHALDRYTSAAVALAGLPDDQAVLDALAALPAEQRTTLRACIVAAASDAAALRALGEAAMFRKVDGALHAELVTILEAGHLPLAPQLEVWRKKALQWIEARLSAPSPPQVDVPPSTPEPPPTPAGRTERTVRLQPEASQDASLVQVARALADVRAAAPAATIEVRIRAD